jgi:hypothetical protein
VVSKADHDPKIRGRAAGFGGSGKFDRDLKAKAPAKTGTGRSGCRRLADGRDSMTLPEDHRREESGAPEAAPVDTTPEILQREPLHFIVVLLLLADIVFGLGLAVFAEKVLMFRPMAIMGCGLAALGLGVLAYFVLAGGGKRTRW